MKKLTLILLSVLMIVALAACGNKCEHTYDNACDATCNDCGETREVSAHQWNDATCTTPKTCTVCQATEGEMLPHNWEDATCVTAKACKICGTTEGAALGHSPAEDDGDCGTDVLCTVCGAVTTPARLEHIAHADDGNCTTPVTCTECGWLMKPAQEHNFNGDWKTDADGHWHVCQNIDCKVAGTKEAHNKGEDGKCTVCGHVFKELSPGGTSSLVIPSIFEQADSDDDSIVNEYMYMIAETVTENGTDKITYKYVPAIFTFHIQNRSNKDIILNSITLRLVDNDGKIYPIASREVSVKEGEDGNELVYSGTYDEICVTVGTTVQDSESFVAYSLALILPDDNAFEGKNIEIVIEIAEKEFVVYSLDSSVLADINTANECNWVEGNKYTFRVNTNCYNGCSFDENGECTVCGSLCSHEVGADDNDCTTAVHCVNCNQILIPAKEAHVATKNPATCITMGICDECGTHFQPTDPNNHKNPELAFWYYDENSHVSAYTCCGKTVSYEPHNGEATCMRVGYCTICEMGYREVDPSNHASDVYTYTDNGDGTHTKRHECGEIIVNYENHAFGTTGVCICGAKATASVTDGSTKIYADVYSLKAAVSQLLSAGATDITVDLPEDASAEMLIAIRRALVETENVVEGSINLTLTGVKAIPDYTFHIDIYNNGSGIFGMWCVEDELERVYALGSVTLTDATYIGNEAFTYTYYLSSVSAPVATKIGDAAFEDAGLTEISLPLVKEVGEFAFNGCYNLTKVSLPQATVIGCYAFQSCYSLTEVTLGALESVVHSHYGIFYGANDTSKIDLTLPYTQKSLIFDTNMCWVASDALYTETTDYEVNVFMGYTFKSITITCADGTANHNYSYTNNGDGTHKKVCAECGLVSLESEAHDLTYVNDGDIVHIVSCSLCDYKVSEYHSYNSSVICACGAKAAASVTGGNTTIPANDEDELNEAVAVLLMSGIRDITVDLPADASAEMFVAIRNALIYTEGVDPGSVTLTLTGVETIPEYAGEFGEGVFGLWVVGDDFEEVAAIGSMILADAKYVADYSFYGMYSLKSVSAPLVTELGNGALSSTSIIDVDFPKLEKIGDHSFDSCMELTEISLPSLKEIGFCAFLGCDNLIKAYLPNVSVVDRFVFQNCRNITDVTFGELEFVDHRDYGIFYAGNDVSNINITLACTQKALELNGFAFEATDVLYSETDDYKNNVFMGFTFKSVTLAHNGKCEGCEAAE